MPGDETIINQTRCWVKSVIIGLNFCPFAGQEFEKNRIYYHVSHLRNIEPVLHDIIDECHRLDEDPGIETTLIIIADGFRSFDNYLDMLEMANRLLVEQGYEGIYQLASFHPDYCFADVLPADAANYTNRSPYPMLHLIREASLEQALQNYPEPELIPERNIKLARSHGRQAMQILLDNCLHDRGS